MRYLRLFESNGVIDDIKDICLELEDIGLDVEIESSDRFNGQISISKNQIGDASQDDSLHEFFDYNEVSEVIERLKDYLGDRMISIMVASLDNEDGGIYTWNELDSPNDMWYLDEVHDIEIYFMI